MPTPQRPGLITLLTDFGTADYFVAAMKGVILSRRADARVVDITHEIAPQDIQAAAFTLLAAYKSFPAGTIHLAVVDPGVGSARRPIVASCGNQFFIGPDNGIFSYIFEREPPAQVIHIQNEEYFHHPVSASFHGRDVFAAVAAALAQGVEPLQLGKEITDWVLLESLAPETLDDGSIRARIIHIDRFGNCITNLTRPDLPDNLSDRGLRLSINGTEIDSLRRFFAEEPTSSNDLFAIWGSAGFLEVSVLNASAANSLRAEVGQTLVAWPEVSRKGAKKGRT
ncbi:MAG: SAM-dependent chlorinase/fluorinase [Pyrinomonadaceae bacterium]